MKTLISEITIGNFRFNYVTNLTIESSWDTLTDTASITIPNKFRKDNKIIIAGTENIFKRGDPIVINIGYFPNLLTKFKGFISKVISGSPLTLECEDAMFLLKQINIPSQTFEDTTIKKVIDVVAEGVEVEFDDPNAKIGTFEIDNKNFVNAVSIFEVLKSTFGYQIYFQDEILQVRAMRSILALSKPIHTMNFQRNIIESSLEFKRDDDVSMFVRFDSRQEDNSNFTFFGFKKDGKIVITETPQTGQVAHNWNVPGLSVEQIKKLIKNNIDNFIVTEFVGDFTTFLEPSVSHSDRIDIIDLKNPDDKNGRYLIRSVSTSFGINGGRQVIELKNKISI